MEICLMLSLTAIGVAAIGAWTAYRSGSYLRKLRRMTPEERRAFYTTELGRDD